MGRATTSTILRSPSNSKITKRSMHATNSSMMDNIPRELLIEILCRLAHTSFTDIHNAKLSCKDFHEAAEDPCVYQNMSLDNFPLVAWKPLTKKEEAFFTKCQDCQNPEIPYRQAVLDYFTGKGPKSALAHLQGALNANHIGALYVTCIILLFSGEDELKACGMKLMAGMKKSKYVRGKLKEHRDRLKSMLRTMWVENPALRRRPVCCTKQDNHRRRSSWEDMVDDADVHCEGCSVDSEIKFLLDSLPRL
ncbi:UNVERIFIED_CONTAM: F-box protein [Sesamum indicum]